MKTTPHTPSPDALPCAVSVDRAMSVLTRALERERALARLTREERERERAAALDPAEDAEALAAFRGVLDLELRRDRDADDWAYAHLARAGSVVIDWCARHESVRAVVGAGVMPSAELLAAAIVSALPYRWPDARTATALIGGERAQRKAVAVEASRPRAATSEDAPEAIEAGARRAADLAQFAGASVEDAQRSYEAGNLAAKLEQPLSAAAVHLLPAEVRPRRSASGKARNWAAFFTKRLLAGRTADGRGPKAEIPCDLGAGVTAKVASSVDEDERRRKKRRNKPERPVDPEDEPRRVKPSTAVPHFTRAFVDGDPDLFDFVASCPETLLLGVSRGEVSDDFLRACIAEAGAFTADSLLAEPGVPGTARALRLVLRAALSEDAGSTLRRGLLYQLRLSVGPWGSNSELAEHEGVPATTLRSDLFRARKYLATEVFGPELFDPAYAWAKGTKAGPNLAGLVFV